jgi:hypothetical protein
VNGQPAAKLVDLLCRMGGDVTGTGDHRRLATPCARDARENHLYCSIADRVVKYDAALIAVFVSPTVNACTSFLDGGQNLARVQRGSRRCTAGVLALLSTMK